MRRKRVNRVIQVARGEHGAPQPQALPVRRVRRTLIDFNSLGLPSDIAAVFADGFWQQWGAAPKGAILVRWTWMRVFADFVREHPLSGLAAIDRGLLEHYIEWLNAQVRANGQPWRKSTRSAAFTTLRKLLQWLQRCRPGVIGAFDYPTNPFPWRNRDTQRHARVSPHDLRAVLDACEREITEQRAAREQMRRQIEGAIERGEEHARTLPALLLAIDQRYGGVLPPLLQLTRRGHTRYLTLLQKFGGTATVEPYLYPHADSLLPYFLAILIHTAGNPESIVELRIDCLQSIPLLDDRELVVWTKRRAGAVQRRSFRRSDSFEPPALVREVIEWTARLRPHVPPAERDRLFLFKGQRGVRPLSPGTVKHTLRAFCERHHLARFALASVRPSVLTAFYRACGDLRQVKQVANHASLATTVAYVEGPEVEAQHRTRIATLQNAFIGRLVAAPAPAANDAPSRLPDMQPSVSPGRAVTMFGFDCKDPLAGIAPGSRRGELCTQFLGCFTCPNSVIASDTKTIARLLQARNHLREAAAKLHPARWEAIYAPILRIVEQDVLKRFAARELTAAQPLVAMLPPLPELR